MAYKASNHHSFLFLRCCSAQGKETSDANLCQMNGTKINQESSYLKDQEQNDVVQPPSEVQTKDKSKSYKETTTREIQQKQILFIFLCWQSCPLLQLHQGQNKPKKRKQPIFHITQAAYSKIYHLFLGTQNISLKRSQLMQDPTAVQYCILTSQHRSLSFLSIFSFCETFRFQ